MSPITLNLSADRFQGYNVKTEQYLHTPNSSVDVTIFITEDDLTFEYVTRIASIVPSLGALLPQIQEAIEEFEQLMDEA